MPNAGIFITSQIMHTKFKFLLANAWAHFKNDLLLFPSQDIAWATAITILPMARLSHSPSLTGSNPEGDSSATDDNICKL